MKKLLLTILLLSNFAFSSLANIIDSFPQLSGRVVDNAQLLSKEQKENIIAVLKAHEEKTSNQIVVLTLNSLNGYDIADYSYQLGRYWQIGQKDKDNGVLLVISLQDRKLRIEVGYGLEGALTDKISHEIVEYTLKPKFK
ncbi:MAG: TPM domain-containing protein, partial [Poseidonibacter sp.]